MRKIKSYAAFVCMLGFVLFFLTAFVSTAKAKETYTLTVKYEPQQAGNGKTFPGIKIIDKTTGQLLRGWVMAETLEVEVPRGHEIEVRFKMAPGNQFYGIVRSDGWCGGTFTQGTASFEEAKGSQKFGFAGRGNSITDEDAINGWMTTQNSSLGYYYYYLGVNNDNTIYLLSYDNIQWFGMTGEEFIMNGGYVSKTTSADNNVVTTAKYNHGPILLDWSPKYIHKGIAHDEFKVGDLFGQGRVWGTKKDCIALYGGISDKKVVTYASDTTTAKSSVYEYPKGTIDAEWSLKDEGITRVDLVNTSPRGAVTTGQVLCKIYDNTVTITDYFTADSYPEGAVYDEKTGYYKIVTTDYGGEYHSTYTADTTDVYEGYVINSDKDNKISIIICDGEDYYKSDKNQIVRYWRPKTQNYTLYFDYNKPDGAHADVADNSVTSKKVYYKTAVGELPQPTLKGYTFTGWQDENGKTYTEDTVYNILGDTTLYAYWNADVNIEWNASLSKINDDSINALNLTNDDSAISWKFGLGYGKVMHNTLTFTEFGDMRGFLNVKINNVVPTKIKYEFSDTRINSIQLSNCEHVDIGIENGKAVYLHNVSSAASNGYLHRICFNIPDYEAEFDVNKEKEYSAYVDISVSYNRNNTGETTETRRVYYNLEELDVSKVHSRIRRQPGQANN